MRSFKLKVVKYCILNQSLFWKDPRGIMLNCVEEDEDHRIMAKMHKEACGAHHCLQNSHSRVLMAFIFIIYFAKVNAYKECQMFVGK